MQSKTKKAINVTLLSAFEYTDYLLYFRFCKNAIFQNFGNIMFFCRFAFFSFFFLPPTFLSRLLTDLRQNRYEHVFLHAIYTDEGDFWKDTAPKNSIV